MEKKKLYVLIDQQLDPIYGCVQAGHAVAQYLLDNKNQTWNNQYLIYIKADIEKWKQKLNSKKIKFSEFIEPDLDNKLTAIALESDGTMFKKLKLIGS